MVKVQRLRMKQLAHEIDCLVPNPGIKYFSVSQCWDDSIIIEIYIIVCMHAVRNRYLSTNEMTFGSRSFVRHRAVHSGLSSSEPLFSVYFLFSLKRIRSFLDASSLVVLKNRSDKHSERIDDD